MDEVFSKYRNVLKPLLAEIEAEDLQFPTAILNEIRSAFDHLARHHADNSGKSENLVKAVGHIDRAIFDCYKWLIVSHHDRIEAFQAQNEHKDWSTVDGGRFNSKFCELRCEAKNSYITAKRQPDSGENWSKAYHAYFDCLFLNHSRKTLFIRRL